MFADNSVMEFLRNMCMCIYVLVQAQSRLIDAKDQLKKSEERIVSLLREKVEVRINGPYIIKHQDAVLFFKQYFLQCFAVIKILWMFILFLTSVSILLQRLILEAIKNTFKWGNIYKIDAFPVHLFQLLFVQSFRNKSQQHL